MIALTNKSNPNFQEQFTEIVTATSGKQGFRVLEKLKIDTRLLS